MKLYGVYLSPFTARVMMQLKRKGIAFELVFPPGGLHSDEYKEINYMQRIPALDLADGTRLYESGSIAEYIETAYPHPSLLGSNPEEAATIRLISRLADIYLLHTISIMFDDFSAKKFDTDVIRDALKRVQRGLKDINDTLERTGFTAKNDVDFADCTLVPALVVAEVVLPSVYKEDYLANLPFLQAYWRKVQELEFTSFFIEKERQAFRLRIETGQAM